MGARASSARWCNHAVQNGRTGDRAAESQHPGHGRLPGQMEPRVLRGVHRRSQGDSSCALPLGIIASGDDAGYEADRPGRIDLIGVHLASIASGTPVNWIEVENL